MSSPGIYVVIVAGGSGTRMGNAVPKQFLELAGKPVLYHTIKAFAEALPDAQLVLVLPPQQLSYAQMVLQPFRERIDITLAAGGETRFHSVRSGLKGLPEDSVILVHDGVRPVVSAALIRRCYEQALGQGSAIPAVPVTDSIRMMDGSASKPVDRTLLRSIQTPQAFRASILLPAFEQPYRESFTDEASVVEAAGGTVILIEGERGNLKITTPEDLAMAEVLLQRMNAL